ncbi:MAG: hypothetical protein JWN78_550 [Bacteroidota bacterium]|nr:hypothetical protein [Bacteroidota bacterium]
MIRTKILSALLVLLFTGCHTSKDKVNTKVKCDMGCTEGCKERNSKTVFSCKLTTPELQKRKETVVASLKSQVIEKRELKDGYAFRFPGTDKMLEELTEFVKTERACCDFFTFNLLITGDKKSVWLELTGPAGAKDFISGELGM